MRTPYFNSSFWAVTWFDASGPPDTYAMLGQIIMLFADAHLCSAFRAWELSQTSIMRDVDNGLFCRLRNEGIIYSTTCFF